MSKNKKQIHFNAFEMNCITHLSAGLWRYPNDEALRYKDIEYWQNIAKIAEKGLFDAIFIADVLGVYDIYNNSADAALRGAVQTPVNDPIQLAAIGASVTQNLGFGITAGVAFEQPFPFARRLSTLDHLTKGRVGWNIVTGYLPSANANLGEKELPHDERYALADEYMEVIYKLLEGSWEDDAVVLDKKNGIFADPNKIHAIKHKGKYFEVPGFHVCEPSIQRTPVLFQAGNSPRGLEFAAKHAEAIFIAPIAKEYTKTAVKQVREALVKAGRDPYSAKIYVLATIITDKTEALARAKYKDLLSYVSEEGSLVLNSGWLGENLGKYALDDKLSHIKSNAILGKVEEFAKSRTDEGKDWTLRELIKIAGIGALGQKIIGGAKEVATELERLVEYSDADGFNLAYATTPGTFEDVVEFIVPELQKRGSYKLEYTSGSLRNKLFGKGDRLDEKHNANSYRIKGK
ncbi:5,10-methylene tetrahydromethanopterin reductase [Campylobacter sp. MIT 12-8780]|uniref:LLM class flavin-dependent oxidoreductase n=1 Tax=Campylobacter sp. MIT 12-8780 TaxID=2202200 RepID=UPI00115D4046|nr:LLM class flavin-dependent oxidoreductase [Campylobacter sp. MIT 12-8780]TQR41070.1 5,10-methylene tetrahydromethanopterin reductase [Campylobacter sp. MIT 12-8780]